MKKAFLNFGLMSLLFIGLNLMLSTVTTAQKLQWITGSIKHNDYSIDNGGCSSVQLLVSYSYNGSGYAQISASQTIAKGNIGYFSVSIPASATNIVKSYKISMSQDYEIHNFDNIPALYSYYQSNPGYCGGGENWLYCEVMSGVNNYWLDL